MKSAVDLYEFAAAKHGPENLRPFLIAVEEAERWEIVRRVATNLLVVFGGLCWLMAAIPAAFGSRLHAFLLGLWAVGFVLLVMAIAAGRVWRRRCERYRIARVDASDLD